jgi:hypothetical protein
LKAGFDNCPGGTNPHASTDENIRVNDNAHTVDDSKNATI